MQLIAGEATVAVCNDALRMLTKWRGFGLTRHWSVTLFRVSIWCSAGIFVGVRQELCVCVCARACVSSNSRSTRIKACRYHERFPRLGKLSSHLVRISGHAPASMCASALERC
jgi:hypothetical protein